MGLPPRRSGRGVNLRLGPRSARSAHGADGDLRGGNLFAIEVLRAAHDMGLRVPADLSVATFDDPHAGHAWPRLTSVAAPAAELTLRALDLIVLQLDRGSETAVPAATVVQPRLTVRESTGPAPEGAPASP